MKEFPNIPIGLSDHTINNTSSIAAMALGASIAAMAQPIIRHLRNDGQKGVHLFLDNIREEIRIAMLLLGVSSVHDIGQQHIYLQ
jgi:isopentenyl diphosphate isomerase/L-lactate dehydrogenase-like FMN-dependent dehydrogenase